ncbi:MAG: hypothetical protein MK141_15135 [Pseudoxanthomonas sp.]|jgi:hypothetical protein|uniref:hypothetical protein n=1 Tax=Pseudoxanthomonas TaxID=83618 RepID=UPI00138A1F25|nr:MULTISPECIES: hypothetical protein [Pseudoxanthomonas]MCH2092896.1 hypothetical protein [Pseudoxanthomonas sp.]
MSVTHRFIADPAEPSEVMAWFRSLSTPVTEVQAEYGHALYFRDFGPLSYLPDGGIDADTSPVVSVVLPQVRRGSLWTIGEVHFRATPLRKRFPLLHKVNSAFSKWLSTLECVYSNQRSENPYSYYLEGSAKNQDAAIFAFHSGLEALKRERYFVGHMDNPHRLHAICRMLQLRGVDCAEA